MTTEYQNNSVKRVFERVYRALMKGVIVDQAWHVLRLYKAM
jgi:hypothetical protein